MKLCTLHVILALLMLSRGLAGDTRLPPALEPCFRDFEFHVDLFGSAMDAESAHIANSGYGGGVAAGVSFMRYFGFAVDAVFADGISNARSEVSGCVVVRYPVEFATLCFAPYLVAGAGVTSENRTFAGHAGGGIEWRTRPALAMYAEGRCTRSSDNDYDTQGRLGIRLIF